MFLFRTYPFIVAFAATIIVVGIVAHSSPIRTTPDGTLCTPLIPQAQSRSLIEALDKTGGTFASSTFALMGYSAERGTQKNFYDNGHRKIVEQRFYGNTGHALIRFYYLNNKIFAVVQLRMLYEEPISGSTSPIIRYSEENDYFLNADGQVCQWTSNGHSRSPTPDIISMIADFIANIDDTKIGNVLAIEPITPQPGKFATYRSKNYPLSFQYPDGWIVDETPAGVTITILFCNN
jgi:hypothetical protein